MKCGMASGICSITLTLSTGCGPATTPPDIVLTHAQGHDVNFSPDGEFLVASVMQSGIAVWTTEAWEPQGTLLDDLHVSEFWFTGNLDVMAIALYPRLGGNYKLRLFNLAKPQSARTYEAFDDFATPALSSDERSLPVVIPEDRALYIRDLASNQLRFVYGPDKTEKIDMVGFSPDDRLVVTTVIKEIKDEV
jgi:WD40 repeat protein